MVTFKLNGLEVQAEEGTTILEVCKFYGIDIPTLCYYEGLEPYGGCRLCLVEIGEGDRTKIVSSCTYRVEEGLTVRTNTKRVVKARKMMIELLLAILWQRPPHRELCIVQRDQRQPLWHAQSEECRDP